MKYFDITRHELYEFEGTVACEDLSDEQLKSIGMYWTRSSENVVQISISGTYSLDFQEDDFVELKVTRLEAWSPDSNRAATIDLTFEEHSKLSDTIKNLYLNNLDLTYDV